ncbi:MAG TPA: hypothetical protein PLI09_06425 [Candidatus Hydrogenedentes bacterium]|nr:hypothetical protein [Candidatus Hydrogenedentota bacterium]
MGAPFYRMAAHLKDRLPTSYSDALWLPGEAETIHADAHYAVRVANRDVPWWIAPGGKYGINILGAAEVLSANVP